MKVKIKGLNEEVEVGEEKDVINNRIFYYDKVTHQRYPEDMIEIVDDYATEKVSYVQMPIDWQHYRIRAAIAAMQGMVISDAYCSEEPVGPAYQIKRRKWAPARIAQEAVAYADFLIAELQMKGGQDD